MDLLKQLEQKAKEYWQKANETGSQKQKQRLLRLHKETYLKYKRHKIWLTAIGDGR
jgi:hypothetical protein